MANGLDKGRWVWGGHNHIASAVEDAGESMSGRDTIVNGVSRSDVALRLCLVQLKFSDMNLSDLNLFF